MKNIFLYLLIALVLFSCKRDKYDKEYCDNTIEQKIAEINQLIEPTTADTNSQCRLYYLLKGDGCGPIFVYSINGVDTVLLQKKFDELGDIEQECMEQMQEDGIPIVMCDRIFPDTFLIVNSKCVGCYKDTTHDCLD